MSTYLELTLVALAAWQLVDTWLHGSIFAEMRDRVESRGDLLSELARCPYCLSHHAPWVIMLMIGVVGFVWPGAARAIVASLAITRVIVIADHLSPAELKLDRDDLELNIPEDTDDDRRTGKTGSDGVDRLVDDLDD